jgi:hypothetical protein
MKSVSHGWGKIDADGSKRLVQPIGLKGMPTAG